MQLKQSLQVLRVLAHQRFSHFSGWNGNRKQGNWWFPLFCKRVLENGAYTLDSLWKLHDKYLEISFQWRKIPCFHIPFLIYLSNKLCSKSSYCWISQKCPSDHDIGRTPSMHPEGFVPQYYVRFTEVDCPSLSNSGVIANDIWATTKVAIPMRREPLRNLENLRVYEAPYYKYLPSEEGWYWIRTRSQSLQSLLH